MKKNIFSFREIHVFADGAVMTGEEFDRCGKVFKAKNLNDVRY